MRRRKYVYLGLIINNLAGEWVERHDLLNFIAKHLNPHGKFFIHGDDLYRVSADPEGASFKSHIVSLILNIDELS